MGTGPYKFVEWIKDDRVVFEANADYWGGAPQVKRLVFRPIPEGAARVAALQAGDIDIATLIPLDAWDRELSKILADKPGTVLPMRARRRGRA